MRTNREQSNHTKNVQYLDSDGNASSILTC